MRPKSMILLSLALGCGLVASLGINQVMSKGSPVVQSNTEVASIFVAKKEINLNDLITPEFLKVQQWPKDKLPQGAITKLENVDGRRARSKFYVDEPLLDQKLLPKGEKGTRPTDHIPPGHRVVAIKVDATATGGYLIKPGDHVDLMIYLRRNTGIGVNHSMTKTFLQNIKVFAVDDVLSESPDGKSKGHAKTISLVVTPDQAEVVNFASRVGKITLSMRSAKDDVLVDTGAKRVHDVLGLRPESSETKPVAAAPKPDKGLDGANLLGGVLGGLSKLTKNKTSLEEPWVTQIFDGQGKVQEFEIDEDSWIPRRRDEQSARGAGDADGDFVFPFGDAGEGEDDESQEEGEVEEE